MAERREPVTLRRIVGGKGGIGLAVVCGALAALCIGIGAVNLRDARRSEAWPRTSGEIVHAEVEEHVTVRRDKDGERTSTDISYASNIAYTYRVAGREHQGQRVRWDWELERTDAEATVARYPVGSGVTVYYDPDDPANAVLEPGGAAYGYQVLIGLGVFFLAIPALWFAARALVLTLLPGFRITIDRNMAGRVERAQGWRAKWAACNWIQKTVIVIFGPLLGAALAGWLAFGAWVFSAGMDGYLHPDTAGNWPAASGQVVVSELKPILVKRSDDLGRGGTFHRYDLRIEVEYRVLANRYTLEHRFGVIDEEEQARATLARFPRGGYVNVYYDPADPGDAALTRPEPAGLGTAILGALMLAPWVFAGLALGWLWVRRRYLTPRRPAAGHPR